MVERIKGRQEGCMDRVRYCWIVAGSQVLLDRVSISPVSLPGLQMFLSHALRSLEKPKGTNDKSYCMCLVE